MARSSLLPAIHGVRAHGSARNLDDSTGPGGIHIPGIGLRALWTEWSAEVRVLGYVVALGLLLNSGSVPFVNLVFPLWTLVLSIHILLVAPDGLDSVSTAAT
jgi:hypothetical protein